ncbi:MAG TPA: ABC transporter ATP-binding protein [Candidatus Merdivicinus faecavium]|nr:ABC transporter ATP-binding protein [Candidatus Merdivicinus faecavium]
MALIEMENICKTYRAGEHTVEALRDVSLSVEEGEFVAVVGSSGSGKSTLMNLLGCLDLPDSGSYFLDGVDIPIQDEPDLCRIRNRKIGFIFQHFHLIPTLTAAENIELPLSYRGIPRAERKRLAAEALDKMGLLSRASHRPAQLSGGQQQRVAIARAIAARPPLILADEPTGNLDSATGREVMDTLLALNGEGHTIILITHDPGVAAMAGRIVRIQDGRMENPPESRQIYIPAPSCLSRQ